ncbi:hypothetical protein [Oceanicola sp. S124]|uniref:hypothetical protein n=1 Tax=Oceanicola sp. S124 TaxID=1042378 RepID=UPI0002557E0C|nr:hypothetical protein [Oceanicola sp. S124]
MLRFAAALLIAAAPLGAPLVASAQGLVVNDIYQGHTVPTYGTSSYYDSPAITPYPSDTNYCPAGLQPVVLGGEVSCGVPNVASGDWNRHGTGYRGYADPSYYGSKSPN